MLDEYQNGPEDPIIVVVVLEACFEYWIKATVWFPVEPRRWQYSPKDLKLRGAHKARRKALLDKCLIVRGYYYHKTTFYWLFGNVAAYKLRLQKDKVGSGSMKQSEPQWQRSKEKGRSTWWLADDLPFNEAMTDWIVWYQCLPSRITDRPGEDIFWSKEGGRQYKWLLGWLVVQVLE